MKLIKHFFSPRNNPMKIRTHEVDVFDLIVLPTYLGYNTRHISWDGSGIFCPLNVGFFRVRMSETKILTLGGKEHNFLSEYGTARGVPT